jgi:hypothetical protein
MTAKKPLTHTAYAFKREGRRTGRWLECGCARIENAGADGHHVYLDRTPIGGFTGHIYLLPIGTLPVGFTLDDSRQPIRPDERQADDDEDG